MSETMVKPGTILGFLALAIAAATAGTWFYRVRMVDIPEDRTLFVICFLAAAGVGIAALVKGAGKLGVLPALLAIVVGAFLPFTIAISEQQVATTGVQVGETIPHFTALDDRREMFDSKNLAGRPVLMKFFRAHW
ncbi:MAG: hypothetical protein QF570_10535 [Myxococcota bacterium]|jgi:hypothetical protein|nr:hypothetical protein [Myxococcota bacterium]